MKLKVVTRSGRELIPGGLEVKDGVSEPDTPPRVTLRDVTVVTAGSCGSVSSYIPSLCFVSFRANQYFPVTSALDDPISAGFDRRVASRSPVKPRTFCRSRAARRGRERSDRRPTHCSPLTRLPRVVALLQATTEDLKAAFAAKKKKFYPTRQRWTLPVPDGSPAKTRPTALVDGKSLSKDYGLKTGSTVCFKDLGTQVPYAVVFLAEYAGPMLAYLPFYFLRKEIYGDFYGMKGADAPLLLVQTLAMVFHTVHYAKRILETLFVHHFSHATMPIFNLFRNCGYYWGFAAFMSYFINHPQYTPVSETQMYAGFALSALMQLGNLHCHVYQSSLRSDGSKDYKEPKGGLFKYVTCANYMCEIYQWVGFNIATQSAMGWFFVFCGGAQMMEWANAKHRRLKKLFPGFKRSFKLLPPFY